MKILTEKTLSEIQREWFERYQIARALSERNSK